MGQGVQRMPDISLRMEGASFRMRCMWYGSGIGIGCRYMPYHIHCILTDSGRLRFDSALLVWVDSLGELARTLRKILVACLLVWSSRASERACMCACLVHLIWMISCFLFLTIAWDGMGWDGVCCLSFALSCWPLLCFGSLTGGIRSDASAFPHGAQQRPSGEPRHLPV